MRKQAPKKRPKTLRSKSVRKRCGVLIIGMHRSGTSALTRVLSLLGCDLPATMMKANDFNEAGYWESTPIQQFNDRILQSAGTNWYDWQEFYPDWFHSPKANQFREEALTLLKSEFDSSYLFVLKDPRLCRMLPFWLSVLEDADVRPLILSPVRNPLEVAASLARRNGFDPSFSTLLWLRNVLDAELASRGVARFFTSYDGLQANWNGLAQKAQSELGVVWPRKPENAAAEINAFLSQGLHHHRLPAEAVLNDPAVSGWLVSVYQVLSGWAQSGEKAAEYATLDRVRTEFGAASPAISQLIAAEQKATGKAKSIAKELGETRDRIAKTEANLASETQRAGRFEQELGTTKGSLAEKEKRIAALASDLTLQAQAAEKAQTEKADRASRFEQELETAKNSLAEKEKRIAALAGDFTIQAQAAEKTQAEISARASRFEQELETAKNSLAEKEKRITALTSDLTFQTQAGEVARASVAEFGVRLQQAESERSSLSQRFERELGAAKITLAEKEGRIAALASDLTLQIRAVEEAQSNLAEIAARLDQVEAGRISESQRAGQLENELGVMRDSLNEREKQFAAIANELVLQTQVAESTAQARAAESRRAEMLEQALESLRNELAGRDQRIALLVDEVTLHGQSAQEVQARLIHIEAERTSEAQRTIKLEDELGAALGLLNEKEDQIVALATELERQVKTLEGNLASEAQKAKQFQHELGKAQGSLVESEKRMAALAGEIKSNAQARDKAEAALAEAHSRLAQTESALVQRRHEADQTAEELAKAQAQLKQMGAVTMENEKLILGLKEHVHLLLADFKERQSQIEALDRKAREQEPAVAQLKQRLDEREKTITQLQGKHKEHLDETVTLSRLAIDREQQARSEAEKAKLIREVAAKELGRSVMALLDNHKWSLLPRRIRLKRQMALLERVGLFDREWYLQYYHDVRESGMDPLRHYAEHGAREGREPNSKLERPKQ